MTFVEVRDMARRKLEQYRKDCAMVAQWDAETSVLSGKSDNMGIRGSATSDPTASVATRRAEPPEYIEEARKWIEAIDNAWAEMQHSDEESGILGSGKAYVMEKFYGLLAPAEPKCTKRVNNICDECAIANSTFYRWLGDCIDTVAHYASGII